MIKASGYKINIRLSGGVGQAGLSHSAHPPWESDVKEVGHLKER
jgi:hypothetical protein